MYGLMDHMARALLLFHYKAQQGDLTVEMVLWQLPARSADRPHGVKYRLHLGRDGKNLLRYDNETRKGDHRHIGAEESEETYAFSTTERLLADFHGEYERLGWRWDK
jgi:Family of unknown function (DUF6516)